DRRALQLRSLVVSGVEVANRSLAGPLDPEEQHADERGLFGRRGRCENRVVGALEPRLTGSICSQCAIAAIDRQLTVEHPSDSRPRMHVAVGDPAWREVDAVAAHDVARSGIVELPEERVAIRGHRAEERLVRRELVDDVAPLSDLEAVRVLGEPQWKYWPPS